jgi:hypothetical protein
MQKGRPSAHFKGKKKSGGNVLELVQKPVSGHLESIVYMGQNGVLKLLLVNEAEDLP